MPSKIIAVITIILISFGLADASPMPKDSIPVLSRPAPEFHLKDLEGKVVSLTDFRGKVIVLDFWATWCVPCQQSFPGIEKAMNHFTGDQDVVFLFIDTRETSPDYPQVVKAQLKKNHYNFHVVFDETGPSGLQNKLYLMYDMPGIPTKFIIDAKGIIRYQFAGFNSKQTAGESALELIRFVERTKAMAN